MNVQENLRKVWNVIKSQDEKWGKTLEEQKENLEPMTMYYAAYYAGATAVAKIIINLWNGELTEGELEHALKTLDNPMNEAKN
jgi:hypothetical protein